MIKGVHTLLYSRDAEATREFLRRILGWKAVDAGEGWLIFAMPPGEMAAHPTDDQTRAEVYFMCEDIRKTLAELERKGVRVTKAVVDQGWGLAAGIEVPGFGEMGLYEPRHPTAIRWGTRGQAARKRPAKVVRKKARRKA